MYATDHQVFFQSSTAMPSLPDGTIQLIVTSPPYPMIEMWDRTFADQSEAVRRGLDEGDGPAAWTAMHERLDETWHECARVLAPGGIMCLNIGDATRSVGNSFRLYPNQARVTMSCEALGLHSLPSIVWRKTTNSPTKFLGSGTLPAGAYVTLEHEYVLVFRKGARRSFSPAERERRRRSAFFWEERNRWFSDQWDLAGVRQAFSGDVEGGGPESPRDRSAAYPLELAYRLINMYSILGDTVLDPFLGTGTTVAAAIAAGRSSRGMEWDSSLAEMVDARVAAAVGLPTVPEGDTPVPDTAPARRRAAQRIADHHEAMAAYEAQRGRPAAHVNRRLSMPVVTRQERELEIPAITTIRREAGDGLRYRAAHEAISS